MVVLPFGFPTGTGSGSARRTTPATFDSAVGRSQLAMKRPASVRQIAAAHEILVANSCLLSIVMIALKNAPCCAQQVHRRFVNGFLLKHSHLEEKRLGMLNPHENVSTKH